MKLKNFLVLCLLSLTIFGCATGGAPKTSLELQAFQRKEFETTKKIAFASTLSVFQDLGYIIKAADVETGLITASSPTKNTVFFGSYMENTDASAFVEEITTKRTFVRVNFVKVEESSSSYGMKTKSDRPIQDPKIYEAAFQKIQEAIFIRANSQ